MPCGLQKARAAPAPIVRSLVNHHDRSATRELEANGEPVQIDDDEVAGACLARRDAAQKNTASAMPSAAYVTITSQK